MSNPQPANDKPPTTSSQTALHMSHMEKSLDLIHSEVCSWFSGTQSPAASPSIPQRPSRAGLGATPSQIQSLRTVNERKVRDQIIHRSKRSMINAEFDNELDLRYAMRSDKNTSSTPESPGPDDDETSRTRAPLKRSSHTSTDCLSDYLSGGKSKKRRKPTPQTHAVHPALTN